MFSNDVNTAVDCFRPLLKRLNIKNDVRANIRPTCLIEVPELDFLGQVNWTLATIREKATDSSCGRLITRYRTEHNCIQSIIYLDETLYCDTPIARKKRRIVAVHEFCHFAASVYAYMTDKNKFIKAISEKRDNKVGDIWNEDVSFLYRLLNESEKNSDTNETINTFQHSQHAHFFLGMEDIGISYTDLYLNLLFSRGAFEEFFDFERQKQFFSLWLSDKRQNALELYDKTIIEAAAQKWVPEQFAISQAHEWLADYIRKPIKLP
jgi:hypothetical protein